MKILTRVIILLGIVAIFVAMYNDSTNLLIVGSLGILYAQAQMNKEL